MPSEALLVALAAISAAAGVLRARTPGTPAGDRDEDHPGNTFELPAGAPIRKEIRAFARRQLKRILGTVPTIGEPLPAALPSLDAWTGPMASAMTPLISAYWDEAGTTTRERLGLDPDAWEVHDPHLHAKIQGAALAFCESTNATTDRELAAALAALRDELAAGLVDRGESIPELTARVRKVFKGLSVERAERIARTEAARAVHAASLESARESGVVAGKHWLVSAGSCDRCREVARSVDEHHPEGLPLDEPFATGQSADPAYADVPHPPLHPNCRCSITFTLTHDYGVDLAAAGAENPEGFRPGPLGPDPSMFELPTRHPIEPTPAEPIGDYLPTDEEMNAAFAAAAAAKKAAEDAAQAAKKKAHSDKIKAGMAKAKAKKAAAAAAQAAAQAKANAWPADPDKLTVIKALGGSTGAELVEDPDTGRRFARKRGKNPGHLREEDTADRLYRAMGLTVPDSKLYDTARGPVKLSAWIEGDDLGRLESLDRAAYDRARDGLRKGFVADCLLANWDVIGLSKDNIKVGKDGTVYRMDNGGGLRYRAQGGIKSPTQFGPVVGELKTLRAPHPNAAAYSIFGGITDDEVKAQCEALWDRRAAILAAAPVELRKTLEERLTYLRDWYDSSRPRPPNFGGWTPTPADRFKTFSTTAEAHRWAEKEWDAWAQAITPQQRAAIARKAIGAYKGSDYHAINGYHRGPKTGPPSAEVAKYTAELDAVLAAHPVPEPIQVIRHFGLSSIGRTRDDLALGDDLIDHGYVSTSVNPEHSWHGQRFEIRVPAGTEAGYVRIATNSHAGEYELLLGATRPDIVWWSSARTRPGPSSWS